MLSEIIVGAGPFEEVESSFRFLNGVVKTQVGYIDGTLKNPTFEDVCSGKTGHAFTVLIKYNSDIISLSELLDLFFMIHDPTYINRQAHYKGEQFRSCLFYKTHSENEIIKKKINEIKSFFQSPIITEIQKRSIFYPAERKYQHQKPKEFISKIAEVNKEKFLSKKLTHEQYWIMRGKGTEPPFSGAYLYSDEKGSYHCAACGQKLFLSQDKFQSGCGWPAFSKALLNTVQMRQDLSHFMIRTEVLCSRCRSHLGHLFTDGPTPSGLRYCINSLALSFKPTKKSSK